MVQSSMAKRVEDAAPAKRVTLQSLAQHLGLSTTTVSVVVSDAPAARGIPLKTRERILEAAQTLKYRPNYMARSLRGVGSMSIGILAPETSEGSLTMVMYGVEQYLLNARYLYFKASHYHKQELIDEYARLLVERSVDGLLLINSPVPKDIALPTVTILGRSELPGVTNILLDHRRAAVLALSYLRDLGHRKIAFMKGQSFNADTEQRWSAIEMAARELGVAMDPDLSLQLDLDVWSPCMGYEPVRELLRRTRDFTALFCFNDLSAMGAIRALHDAGIRVPEEVSVIGFDDITGAAYGIPSLTTVRQPLEEMGRLAAATLLDRIKSPGGEFLSEITLQPSLVLRESTAVAAVDAYEAKHQAAG
jgi:DNA-binding LacI/PurR family transcriptional regulator